jgi:hypothetical protein
LEYTADPWPTHIVLQLVEAGMYVACASMCCFNLFRFIASLCVCLSLPIGPLSLIVLVAGLWFAYGRRERNIKSSRKESSLCRLRVG